MEIILLEIKILRTTNSIDQRISYTQLKFLVGVTGIRYFGVEAMVDVCK